MEIKSNEQKPVKLARYPLASAGRRLICRILDILLVSLVVFGLSCAIVCSNPGFDPTNLKSITQTWRYLLTSLVAAIVFFLYFIILPRFWKKTLFMKAFKLQYVNNLPLSNFTLGLFKHELMVWVLFSIISLITGIILGSLNVNNAISMIHGISFSKNGLDKSDNAAWFYVGVGFATAYIVAFVVLLFVTIGMFVKNKKPSFHDKFSNVFVIHLKQIDSKQSQLNAKPKARKINYGVPGEISTGSFEEIDQL